ncbi:hypothetical protein [Psychrobacillus vulpis]|uniref:MarR family transcriptional regulator n=1 Tax=Psychrobacillus vulpis TaxID=2325572 RepID=A0A544TT36_9BACI|nr:hypothetical protein [Psychrobacillus vulpis]TQR20622.1 hypothetical protein FG384_05860 [Psychrobacillus vulpis]
MRVAYSVLREIHRKEFIPSASDYGLKTREFENFIFFLENRGYLERVLRVNDDFSIKIARLTKKGVELLETNKHLEETYPERFNIKAWIQIEKLFILMEQEKNNTRKYLNTN